MSEQVLSVRHDGAVCFLQFLRGAQGNALNDQVVRECAQALRACEETATVVVLEGSREVFSLGADFQAVSASGGEAVEPGPLYDLWHRMATGPFVTVCHVRGRANAGGVGFAAASDIVLADATAQFSLSELLFGLFPACVLPFLIRKIGFQRSHYLTLTTQPISVDKACAWGLVDAFEEESEALLRRHLGRLRVLSKAAVARYKRHMAGLSAALREWREPALSANREIFSDPVNLGAISRYVETGKLPWEE